MDVLAKIIISTFSVSLISLIGALTLILKEKLLNKITLVLVSLSAGILMGVAFLHLIPESTYNFPGINVFIYTLVGFVVFFLIEKVLQWRHCHEDKCTVHTFAYMNLLGDAVHNFIDGIIIAASFVANTQLGIITSIAVSMHEIPQELGEFAVLIYGGFKKTTALLFNFLSAVTAILGGVVGYFLSYYMEYSLKFFLPFAAGSFIYISASDLIPEIRKENSIGKSFIYMVVFIVGIFAVYFLRFLGLE